MDIKNVDRPDRQSQHNRTSPAGTAADAAPAKPSGPAAAGDRITLTDVALRLGEITQQLSAGPPPLDQQRVDQIRQAIADGRYDVSTENVAARLMQAEDRR